MNQLLLIGVDHNKYRMKNEECIKLVREYLPIAVFTEEKTKWYNMPVYKTLYCSLESFVKVIPICINMKFDVKSQEDRARLELLYAENLANAIERTENEKYVFLVGGLHLHRRADLESPLCFALKNLGCGVSCESKNLFKKFSDNHEEMLEARKNIISSLIMSSLS